MKKTKVFLASSNELTGDRQAFEREIYRKCKAWHGPGVFLHLDIWEDLPARMATTRKQDDYNQYVREADLFVLLAYSKVGMYTAEEFETAFGSFQSTRKPFIFTYFKETNGRPADPSLQRFKSKLRELGHFYSVYKDFNHLWVQFNKELDRMLLSDFQEFVPQEKTESRAIRQGDKSVYIENAGDIDIQL